MPHQKDVIKMKIKRKVYKKLIDYNICFSELIEKLRKKVSEQKSYIDRQNADSDKFMLLIDQYEKEIETLHQSEQCAMDLIAKVVNHAPKK